jgi:hypothetical protein
MKKLVLVLILVIAAAFIFTGCATQSFENIGNPPGFIKGVIHGFILLFSFIASLFTDYEIYAFPNAGGWYNFGYLIGVMLFFGGGGAGAKRKKC